MMTKLRAWAAMVALSHTVFALPFAASAVALSLRGPHAPLTAWRVLALLGCMVTARTSAMAFNRWADRKIDADNPRTKTRHVPSGVVKPREALALAIGCGVAFLAIAATLGTLTFALAPVALAVLLGYSYAKRFTSAAHLWLGVALSLAPAGAWIAMGAPFHPGILLVMVAVATWLFGFDILYSLQDEEFDRSRGLYSVPARFGTRRSVVISALAHVVTVLALAGAGVAIGCGPLFYVGVLASAALLVYEHALVGWGRLEKIDKAFFDVNAWVSVGFFAMTALDTWRHLAR